MPWKKRRLEDAYRFPGFRPSRWVVGVFGDPQVRIMVLEREQKKPLAAFAVKNTGHFTTARDGLCGIFPAGIRACISMWRLMFTIPRVRAQKHPQPENGESADCQWRGKEKGGL